MALVTFTVAARPVTPAVALVPAISIASLPLLPLTTTLVGLAVPGVTAEGGGQVGVDGLHVGQDASTPTGASFVADVDRPDQHLSPDDACSPSARSRVTVTVVKSFGDTPAHRSDLPALVERPDRHGTPAAFRSHACVEAPTLQAGSPVASSSIRQPDDVFVSVASPRAPGTRAVGARVALKRSWEAPDPKMLEPDGDGQHGSSSRADQAEAARHQPAGRAALLLDAPAQIAGASTSAAADRASRTARCCSASRSASSEDPATRASSAARFSGASDPSASAANSTIS